MRDRRWIFATLCILLLAGAAREVDAQYFGRNKVQYRKFQFKILETAHFDIYYYDAAAGVIEIVGRMAERWYSRLSGILRHELEGRQPLIVYASHPDFEQTNAIPEEISEATGGVTEALKRRIVVPLAGPLAETDHVLGHELVHAFQFDITAQGSSEAGYQLPGALRLPLWFVEGMAEYLTLGPLDPHTAMWMRDVAARASLPLIRRLDHSRYFPYRYGHAFWAYVAGRWGDRVVGRMLETAGRAGNADLAIEAVLTVSSDQLSGEWRAALAGEYQPILASREPSLERARPIFPDDKKEARINIAPALSPDGTQIVFLSARDRFSIDMYLADVASGKVKRKITASAVDPHLESLEIVNSAGAWSADGRRFAFAAVRKGRAVLRILGMDRRLADQEVPVAGADEIFNPTWSPDGRRIAFTAMRGGVTDLFILDLSTGAARSLTNDVYADLQPAWSPDGATVAFVTDRFTSRLQDLAFGDYRLALCDVESGRITAVAALEQGKQINPQWTGTDSLFFVADPQGVPDLYRLEFAGNRIRQITKLQTGISSITRLSPAISVAGEAGHLAFSVFQNDGYDLYLVDSPRTLAGDPLEATPKHADASALPPRVRDSVLVPEYLRKSPPGFPSTLSAQKKEYKARLSLDAFGQPSFVAGASSFGAYVGGGTSLYWSDMLGDHNLATVLQVSADSSGFVRNLAALAAYENRKSRWNWGVVGGQVPLLAAWLGQRFETVNGQPAVVQEVTRYWQIQREFSGIIAYPFNRAQRVEFSGGFQNVSFAGNRQTQSFSLQTGELLRQQEEELATPSALSMASIASALVYDQAVFGGTGPILGQRYRLEASAIGGNLSFLAALADYRRYVMPIRPITLAGRVLHYGRYGGGSEDGRLTELFLGYPSLIRGYSPGSFNAAECGSDSTLTGTCEGFDRLLGSRLAVVNAEARVPIFGPLGIARSVAMLPVEAAYFFDAGVAWRSGAKPSMFGGSRPGVSSHGLSVRINILGVLIGQVSYVHPNDRPLKGWHWEFSFTPGF